MMPLRSFAGPDGGFRVTILAVCSEVELRPDRPFFGVALEMQPTEIRDRCFM